MRSNRVLVGQLDHDDMLIRLPGLDLVSCMLGKRRVYVGHDVWCRSVCGDNTDVLIAERIQLQCAISVHIHFDHGGRLPPVFSLLPAGNAIRLYGPTKLRLVRFVHPGRRPYNHRTSGPAMQ